MTSDYWSFVQSALIYAFGPIISYWLVAVAVLGVLVPLYNMMFGFFRWLTGRGTLI